MKFAHRVEGRNLCNQSNKGQCGGRSAGVGLVQSGFLNGQQSGGSGPQSLNTTLAQAPPSSIGQCRCYPQNAMVGITRWDAGELENFNYDIPCEGHVGDSTLRTQPKHLFDLFKGTVEGLKAARGGSVSGAWQHWGSGK